MKTKVTLEIDTDDEEWTADQLKQAVRDWLAGLEHGDFTLWVHDSADPNEAQEVFVNKIEVE